MEGKRDKHKEGHTDKREKQKLKRNRHEDGRPTTEVNISGRETDMRKDNRQQRNKEQQRTRTDMKKDNKQ